MAICEWCENEFDKYDAESEFLEEYGFLSYENFRICLCGECAKEAISQHADGVYYEHCEECGEDFDYITDSARFENKCDGITLSSEWDSANKILCCDCAVQRVEEEIEADSEEGYI